MVIGLWSINLVWICYLAVSSYVSGVFSELCYFSHASNTTTASSSQSLAATVEDCTWGCCGENLSSCCPVLASFVLGVILAGVFLVALATALVCYYCVYRRNEPCINCLRRCQHREQTQSADDPPNLSVIYHSETGASNILPPYQRHCDAPPSYEDVMKGQINSAFKSVTEDDGGQQGV